MDRHIRLMEPGGEIVVGPEQIALVEQLREEANIPPQIERITTDIFVFARGEPSAREITKIGGLPYWPSDRPWPQSAAEVPMTYIAQVCFADSRDLVGDLPGDILLIFGEQEGIWEEDPSAIRFEWMSIDQPDLISQDDVPSSSWDIVPCYGQLFRTHDSPGSETHLQAYERSGNLAVLEGTKIGGVPRWIQGDSQLPGRFLCSIGSIAVGGNRSFPFVNVSEPPGWRTDDYVMWGDMGSFYIFITGNAELRWTIQCY